MNTKHCVSAVLVIASLCHASFGAQWKPAASPLMTRWAKEVSPDNVLPEYPRPQMVRDEKSWTNLNGLWDYAIRPKDAGPPIEEADWDGKILVPFCVESALSGVKKTVGPDNMLWYRRRVPRSELPDKGRLLLHFGACDWHTTVSVNGFKVGEHKGGYDPFTFDVTEAFGTTKDISDEILISVWDPTDASYQPRGKQVQEPRGIWYTSVTGIWQTVWLERVPEASIESLAITSDLEVGAFYLQAKVRGKTDGLRLSVRTVPDDGGARGSGVDDTNKPLAIMIEKPQPWSPDHPKLYHLIVELSGARGVVDKVQTYAAFRKIEVKKDVDGFNRLFLNNEPLFQYGPLDQGWWPDGLYTAPTDDALKYDIEMTKKLGFNMARKHVKVEPARWYYWCDKLGLLVWQDMPNGDRHIRRDQPDIKRSKESEENFRREWQAIMDANSNHPSIITWVPFNEGWGQFKTNEILNWTKKHDPTRLVDGPSGWTDRGGGDLHDMHRYPGPSMFPVSEERASVLGEFGGLGWPVKDHLWWDKRNWGYRTYQTQAELQQNYETLMHKLRPLIGQGLAAAIYTQTTDVEGEVNGLMTYDRALVKLDAERVTKLHKRFYEPPPIITTFVYVPTSEKEAQKWKYTMTLPKDSDDKWFRPDFDDERWPTGQGGFGTQETPGTIVRTQWKTNDIWLRRTFHLNDIAGDIFLRLHHDEDAEIYINGKLVASLKEYTTEYIDVPLPKAQEILRSGENTLAVHCKQTRGGQYIDVGIVGIIEKPRQ